MGSRGCVRPGLGRWPHSRRQLLWQPEGFAGIAPGPQGDVPSLSERRAISNAGVWAALVTGWAWGAREPRTHDVLPGRTSPATHAAESQTWVPLSIIH